MLTPPQQTEIFGPATRRRWVTLVFAVFALGLLLRLPTFFRPLLSDDEAIYATTADALARGDLLYRDVVDHKPPLIYHVYQAGFALFGAYNTHGAHALVVLSVLLTGVLLLMVRRQEGTGSAGLATAGLFLVFSTTWHDYDALAANCELFMLVPQTLAAWMLLRDFGRPAAKVRGLGIHLGIGLLIGIATLFKYQGLAFLGVSVGMLAWSAFLGRMPWSRAVALAACHGVGSLVPAALYLGWCAAAGNAHAAIAWFLFNLSYVDAGLKGTSAILRGLRRTAIIGGIALIPYALGMAGAAMAGRHVVRATRLRARGASLSEVNPPSPVSVLALLWLGTSAVAVSAGGRFFGHYFHLLLAPLCLFAGPRLLVLWNARPRFQVAIVLLCALPALVFFALASFARPLAMALDDSEPDYTDIAERIAALTSPDERVFIWGNSPQLYVLARRPLGSRFSFSNYMTGESPGTPTETGQWNADPNQLPTAWEMFWADLQTRRPVLFVDVAAAGWNVYDKFPITRYPRLVAYLEQQYRWVETLHRVIIYRRIP